MKLENPAPWGSTDPGLPFGSTKHPYSIFRRHKGKDHKWRYADPYQSRRVVSPVSGVIDRVEDGWGVGRDQGEGWGNHIVIRVNDRVTVRLAHFMNGWSKGFRVGQEVTVGDDIALMGNSGDTRGETHLHEELLIDGVRVDPDLYRGPHGMHLPGTEAPAGGGAQPLPEPTPAVVPEEEDDDMARNSGATYTRKADKKVIHLVYNTDSGFQHEFGSGAARPMSADYLARVVRLHDIPNGFQDITEAHATVIKRGLAAVRPVGAPTDLRVEIIDEG